MWTVMGSESAPVDVVRLRRTTSAAFSRAEKVMVAHDSETCDGCNRPIWIHVDGHAETEFNTPFWVTTDGRVLCGVCAEDVTP